MTRGLRCALMCVWLLTGCRFENKPQEGVAIACSGDSDCPTGLVCNARLARCVSADGDRGAPSVATASVSPRRATRGTTVTLTLTASEPLNEAPTLSLPGAELQTPAGGEMQTFSWRYVVGASVPEETIQVSAELVDTSGNVGTGTLGALTLDFTAPEVLLPTVQIQPNLSRPGENVLVQVAYSEELQTPPALILPDGTHLQPLQQSGVLVVFQVPIAATAADGELPLSVGPATDLAGNSSTTTRVGAVRIDTMAPRITTLSIVNDFTVRSAVTGFNTFTVVAEGDVGTGDMLRSLEVRFLGAPLTCRSPSPQRRECDVTVESTMPEGDATVQAVATDVAGNSAVASRTVRLDFTPPRAVASTFATTLTPPPGSAVTAVDALAEGARAIFSFALTEPVASAPVVTLGGVALNCTNTDLVWQCGYSHRCSELPDGQRTLSIRLVDAVGNAETSQPVQTNVRTDCQAPAAPAVTQSGQVVWHRAPYGSSWSQGQVGTRLELGPQAVNEAVLIVVGTPRPDGGISRLAFDEAHQGQSLLVPLNDGADRSAISVQSWDRAGNPSAVALVRDNKVSVQLHGDNATPSSPGFFASAGDADVLQGSFQNAWPASHQAHTRRLTMVEVRDPGARVAHAMAPLPNSQMLIFGGSDLIDEDLARTRVFDLNTGLWGLVVGDEPSRRRDATAVALADGRVLMAGGDTAAGQLTADTWVFDPAPRRWQAVSGQQPTARVEGTLVALSSGDALYCGGRNLVGAAMLDCWVFDARTMTWRRPRGSQALGPPAVSGMAGVEVPELAQVLFVGGTGVAGALPHDASIFDLSTESWLPVTLSGSPPRLRDVSLFSLGNKKILQVGGSTVSSPASNDWLLDLQAQRWSVTPGGPSPQIRALACRVGADVVALGGTPMRFETAQLKWVSQPSPASYTTPGALAVTLRSDGSALVFGGTPGAELEGRVLRIPVSGPITEVAAAPPPALNGARLGAIDSSTTALTGLVPSGGNRKSYTFSRPSNRWSLNRQPEPAWRSDPAMVGTGLGYALEIGGDDFGSSTATVTSFTSGLSQVISSPVALTRSRTAAVTLSTGQVLVVGGLVTAQPGFKTDTWLYSALGGWSLSPAVAPPVSSPQVVPLTAGAAILIGGDSTGVTATPQGRLAQHWRYSGTTWSKLSTAAPSVGAAACIVSTAGGVLVFGGGDLQTDNNEVWRYDDAATQWSKLSLVDGPSPSNGCRMVSFVDGRALLVNITRDFRNELWLYQPTTDTFSPLDPGDLDLALDGAFVAISPLAAMLSHSRSLQGEVDITTRVYQLNGAVVGGWGAVELAALGIRASQVTGVGAQVTAGATGLTSNSSTAMDGVALDLYRVSETGRLFQQCASDATAGAGGARVVTCPVQPFAGSSRAAVRVRSLGFSHGAPVSITVPEAVLTVTYTHGP